MVLLREDNPLKLSILCVTKLEPFAREFLWAMCHLSREIGAEFVVAYDNVTEKAFSQSPPCDVWIRVRSQGYIESVLSEALAACRGDYILRLDDDERCSPAMVAWLKSGAWPSQPAWTFATAGLWGDAQSVLMMPELWPQYHVRLTTRALAGGQTQVHQRHPVRDAAIAPAVIEHHKYIAKSLDERLAIAARYDAIRPGAGKRCHSVPELAYAEFVIAPLGDGSLSGFDGVKLRRWACEVTA